MSKFKINDTVLTAHGKIGTITKVLGANAILGILSEFVPCNFYTVRIGGLYEIWEEDGLANIKDVN